MHPNTTPHSAMATTPTLADAGASTGGSGTTGPLESTHIITSLIPFSFN